ncbi:MULTISPECIES: hypothetical protein [Leuconostoc]|nr:MULTISPECIES: hypothetical protein [Leuconostoc]MDY5162341.1 hypothetical protein [Leuconostoc citreum]MDY5165911.1 hypothetical protein [Leuconostoc citreum]
MLKNKNFLFLLFSQSAANIGDTLYIISVISAVIVAKFIAGW